MHVNPEVYDRGFSLRKSALLMTGVTGDSLLLLPEGKETDTRDLDDLESDTGNISLCLSSSTETRDKNFIVLVGLLSVLVVLRWLVGTHEVETTIIGNESGNLLSVLDELDTDTLSDSRVGLLGLNTDLQVSSSPCSVDPGFYPSILCPSCANVAFSNCALTLPSRGPFFYDSSYFSRHIHSKQNPTNLL